MDLCDRVEIYIPVEAEVKSIPLCSLSNSVLRRMGLPPSDSNGSSKRTNSPKGVWICPAVIRRKGQKSASHSGNGVMENACSLLGRECQTTSGPFRMSFVFSNRSAYKVLKDTLPGNKLSTVQSHTSQLPVGSAPRSYHTAVVIYAGRVYLSVRKPKRSQSQQEAPQPAPPLPLAVRTDFKTQRKELLKDKKKPKGRLENCKLTRSPNKKGVTRKHKDVSSSTTARSVPQSTGSVHKDDARAEQTTEEAAAQEPDWFQPQEELTNSDSGECEMQELGSAEAENVDRVSDGNVQIDSVDADQGGTQSWSRREPLDAARASTSLQNEYVFNELAQEEKIARLKASLREKKAVLQDKSG